MFTNRTRFRSGRHIHRINKIRTVLLVLVIFTTAFAGIMAISRAHSGAANTRRELLAVWNKGNFEQAFRLSSKALAESPMDFFLLTINGFSAYQLGISQINMYNMLYYINTSIKSLRRARLLREAAGDGRIYYVLGKAYSHRGMEFSDLSIRYLEKADNLGFEASDIPEYLGLAYAASGDFRRSVEAFSRAFRDDQIPSDNLLLSIARSYMAMEEYNMAIGFLLRCINYSNDSRSIMMARLLLAQIYKNIGELDNAEAQYFSILAETGENAEVRYQLGELFFLRGDTARARAEWRNAFRQDPAHARVRARLNI